MTTTIAIVPDPSRAELRLNIQAQRYDHRVARKNERFAKASPARKRVIIAKDVLEWLALDKLHPVQGVYLSPFIYNLDGDLVYDEEQNVKSGKVLDDRVDGGECSVCALGAVFACAVERQGGLAGFWSGRSRRQQAMHEHLAPFFDRAQLLAIESAFEKNSGFMLNMYFGPDDTEDAKKARNALAARAEDFGREYPDAKSRMEAIMLNIIANKGTFVP